MKFDESRLKKWADTVKSKYGKCQKCGSTRNLHAHHIKQKSIHPKYAYTVSNGTCLCRKCHMELHKKIGFGKHSFDEIMSWHKKKKHHKKTTEYRNYPLKVVYRRKKLVYSKTKYKVRIRRRR